MSEIVAVKVPKHLRDAMRRLKDKIKWSEEIRAFIEDKLREAESEENIKKVIQMLRETGEVPKGSAVKSIREDRDSN